jgi:hypothetical protein
VSREILHSIIILSQSDEMTGVTKYVRWLLSYYEMKNKGFLMEKRNNKYFTMAIYPLTKE